MKKILFLGDSITDALRDTNPNAHTYIGQGYALMAAGRLAAEKPGEYQFTNLGISGNRVVDLYARIKKDCWNLQPDVVSILIGVNDVMHEIEVQNGVDAVRFEHVYRTLIRETLERLPHVQLMLMEPFAIHGTYSDHSEEHYAEFRREVEIRAQITKKLAEEFGLVFIPLQKALDDASANSAYGVWSGDGVHPSIEGHALLANAWVDGFKKL